MDAIRILIADDHTFYREGVRTMLGAMPEAEVVGEAASGDEAVAQAAALQPDVILMDIKMPGLNGIEATRTISHTNPHIGILVVTMFDDDESVFAAMQAGARGYLLKDAKLADLIRAVTAVSQGGRHFQPGDCSADGPLLQPAPPSRPARTLPRPHRARVRSLDPRRTGVE